MDINIENEVNIKSENKNTFGSKGLDLAAVILSIVVGLAFPLLVIKDFVGINLFLFSFMAIIAVGYILYRDDNIDIKNFIFFAAAFLIYASVFFRSTQEIYIILTFPALVVMLVLTTMFSTKKGAKKGILTYLYRQFGPIARADKIFNAFSSISNKQKGKKKRIQIALGVLISIGLLIIVIPLMVSAEAAFAALVDQIIEKIQLKFDLQKFFWKTIAGIAIAVIFCGFLYTFTKDKETGTKKKIKNTNGHDNHTMIITVLSIMGLIFLVFAIVQFNSLFISRESIIRNTTFAEIARQGYFQLVILSVINFVMVLLCTGMQKGSNKITKKIIVILTTYFVLLNVYLLVSSAYKMTLYYDAYGMSVDRLLVYILLIYEFAALILLLVKIYKSELKFIKTMVYYTVAFWAGISLINIDALVAEVNINRYEKTGEIDIYYLSQLSDDASDKIKEFYMENYDILTEEELQQIDYYYFDTDRYWLNDDPYTAYNLHIIGEYKQAKTPDSWLEYNISKSAKNRDGLAVLEHLYETGYIDKMKQNKR